MPTFYRRERVESGAINDPRPLNINQNEYAKGFNGGLDRDNIPVGTITGDMVVAGAFTDIRYYPETDDVELDPEITDWQNDDGAGTVIHDEEFTLTEDSTILCEWSGGWEWDAAVTLKCWIALNIEVNGVVVAQTGWISDEYAAWCAALSGVAVANAGPVRVRVNARIAALGLFYGATTGGTVQSTTNLFAFVSGVDHTATLTERGLLLTIRSR